MTLRSALACALIALSLTACEAARIASTPIGEVTVADARNIAIGLKSTYAATEILATEYILLPGCEKPNAPTLCSSEAIVRQMGKIRATARTAINGLEDVAFNATASTPALTAAVSAAQAAYNAFKTITATKKTT